MSPWEEGPRPAGSAPRPAPLWQAQHPAWRAGTPGANAALHRRPALGPRPCSCPLPRMPRSPPGQGGSPARPVTGVGVSQRPSSGHPPLRPCHGPHRRGPCGRTPGCPLSGIPRQGWQQGQPPSRVARGGPRAAYGLPIPLFPPTIWACPAGSLFPDGAGGEGFLGPQGERRIPWAPRSRSSRENTPTQLGRGGPPPSAAAAGGCLPELLGRRGDITERSP